MFNLYEWTFEPGDVQAAMEGAFPAMVGRTFDRVVPAAALDLDATIEATETMDPLETDVGTRHEAAIEVHVENNSDMPLNWRESTASQPFNDVAVFVDVGGGRAWGGQVAGEDVAYSPMPIEPGETGTGWVRTYSPPCLTEDDALPCPDRADLHVLFMTRFPDDEEKLFYTEPLSVELDELFGLELG
ncbi:MAG: hypothetical protein S0880_00235 [Actinomycetota bacterium]|nr:hypothetical protein [Actinomycetota bacterium]